LKPSLVVKRDEQTVKCFSPSPVLIKLNPIQSWSAKF